MRLYHINVVLTLVFAAISAIWWLVFSKRGFIGGFWQAEWSFSGLQALAFSGYVCIGWILVTWQARREEDELRCRKCRHILRGLSEPRCPECGERI